MADLLAFQPNMDIKLHIIAPHERRDKVFQETRRPVFSLLEKGPLADSCTFIYSVRKYQHWPISPARVCRLRLTPSVPLAYPRVIGGRSYGCETP